MPPDVSIEGLSIPDRNIRGRVSLAGFISRKVCLSELPPKLMVLSGNLFCIREGKIKPLFFNVSSWYIACMKCPFCAYIEDKVIDSRLSQDGATTRRRRECLQCAKRFTTYERVEETLPLIMKKDGARETFDRTKISAAS